MITTRRLICLSELEIIYSSGKFSYLSAYQSQRIVGTPSWQACEDVPYDKEAAHFSLTYQSPEKLLLRLGATRSSRD
ncbi:MAG: hypothetical protein Q8P66_01995 [Candidatus Colwellbacteria bacterium]|nr:hypothetical protein [Candidatus Colwellbacteria bacterium]